MNQAFSEFQDSGVVASEVPLNPSSSVVLKRYVRRTLDEKTHEREVEEWKEEQKRQQSQTTIVLSFEELYERFAQKRTHEEIF
jgi:uncharacterized protein YheU (UPF0270 family)